MNSKKLWNIFRDYMEYFLVYAIIGWVYESVWCCMIYHHRGLLVFIIFMLIFFVILGIFTLLKVKKPVWVFVVGTVVATLAELIASYIIEATIGERMWDYTGYFLNFEGRIALVPDLMFGLMIFVAMCLIQPGLKKLQNKFRDSKPHNIGFIIITALFMIDLIARIWLGSNYKG